MTLPDYDIDLFLQERGSKDPLTAEMIVQAYASYVQRLARSALRDENEIARCLEDSFQRVMTSLPEYAPGGDFRSWMLKHAAQTCLEYRQRAAKRGIPPAETAAVPNRAALCNAAAKAGFTPSEQDIDEIALLLAKSEPTANLLLVLRYSEGYDLAGCARMLGINPRTAHAYLDQFRRDFKNALASSQENGESTSNDEQVIHIARRKDINAGLDGLLTTSEANALESHLMACESCRYYERARRKIEKFLCEVGANYWPLEGLAPDRIAELIARARRSVAEGQQRARLRSLLREGLWLALPVFLAVAFVLNYSRFFPEPDNIKPPAPPPANTRQAPPAPTPTSAPTVGPVIVYRANAEIRTGSRPETRPGDERPRISADGEWVVFASMNRTLIEESAQDKSVFSLNSGQTENSVRLSLSSLAEVAQNYSDIFLYSAQTTEIRRISLSPQGEAANGNSFSPAISADGNLITFASYATNLVPDQIPACANWDLAYGCARIYLYDAAQNKISLVSEPDQPGRSPQVSGDGRWILYWAPSTPAVRQNYCRLDIGTVPLPGGECWDLIFYDRLGGRRSRLVVGKPESAQTWTSFVLDISYDGSRVVFELSDQDALSTYSGQAPEAFVGNHAMVYDRPTGVLQPVDANLEDEIPEGASYAGKISHDGRYVAFASSAGDLVAGDENDWIDIFVRDLDSGTTERVSVTSQGEELFSESPFMNQLGTWFTQFDISPDGERVVFLSNAPELGSGDQEWCDTLTSGPVLCYNFYLHKRADNTTESIVFAPIAPAGAFNRAALLRSPDLSENGSRLTYAQEESRCAGGECVNHYIYSSSQAQATPLTRIEDGDADEFERWLFGYNDPLEGGWVTAMAFDPESPILATGSQDGSVRVWLKDGANAQAQPEQNQSAEKALLAGAAPEWHEAHLLDFHSETITDLAFSPSGGLLASGSRDGTVALWWARRGNLRQVLRDHGDAVEAIAFSPGGRIIAAATRNGIRLWAQDEGGNFAPTRVLPPYDQTVTSMDFSPDGRMLAVGGASDGSVWLQPLSFNAIPIRLTGHDRQVSALAFSPGGDWLATASKDGSANLWHYQWAGTDLLIEHRQTHWHSDWVGAIAFSPDGGSLAAGTYSANLYLWDMGTGDLMQTIQRTRQDQVMSVAFSPDESELIYAGAQGTLHLFTRDPREASEQATRFFRRYTSDAIDESFISPSGLTWYPQSSQTVRNVRTPALAQEAVSFPLLASSKADLNLTINAVWIHHNPKTGEPIVIYNFIHTSNFQPSYLVFYQSPDNPREYGSILGASAKISEIEVPAGSFGGTLGEFVQGEWLYDASAQSLPGGNATLHYHWDDEASSYRLRWTVNGIFYSLEYHLPAYFDTVYEEDRLQIEDLLNFAAGLQPVSEP